MPLDVNSSSNIPGDTLTKSQPVPKDLDSTIACPHVLRACKTVDREHPAGDADAGPQNRTVLEQHVDFFDTDGDGIIYPWDTYAGMRRMGFNLIISAIIPILIHGAQSYPTLPGWIPDLRFPIYINKMNKCKHGSDSQVYDHAGRFLPDKFEEIFLRFDQGDKKGLTWSELNQFLRNQRDIYDVFGQLAAFLEWGMTWLLAAEDGVLSKDAMRKQYDGSLFHQKAAERSQRKAAKMQ